MIFKNLLYFNYLVLIPILLSLYILRSLWRNKTTRKHLGLMTQFLTSTISSKKRHVKLVLKLVVLTLLIYSIARPQVAGKILKINNQGVYLFLLVDVSSSMLAKDVKPSRLDFMKQEISRLIDLSSGDKIGLGIFANSAILASPFTKDFFAVKSYLQDISTNYLTNQGTNFEKAFLLSYNTFKKIKEDEKNRAVKVLILASDGESHSLKTQEIIKKLTLEQDVRVFTLSFGTKQGGPIPILDYNNQIQAYKKDAQGNLVVTRLKDKSLKQLAKLGKGSYYHVSYGNRAIEQVRKDLDHLKKSFFETVNYTQKKELYQWFLLLALCLAFLELILSERSYKTSFNKRLLL